MTSNSTDTMDTPESRKDTNTAVAIVLPAIFAIVLLLVLAITFLLPRISAREHANAKEEGRKKRMARLDETIKAQSYAEWTKGHKSEDAGMLKPLCVICLEEVEETAQIRPLRCQHVFHQACLDDWFSRWNEYCPLCHSAIMPGVREMKKRPDPPPIAFMV